MRFASLLWISLLTLWIGLLAPDQCRAGGTPENLILVVNAESASSLNIANHYIKWRNIPPKNVIYLTGISKTHVIGVIAFRKTILEPVLAEIKKENLQRRSTTSFTLRDFLPAFTPSKISTSILGVSKSRKTGSCEVSFRLRRQLTMRRRFKRKSLVTSD